MLIKIKITKEKRIPVGLKDDKKNTPIDNKINVIGRFQGDPIAVLSDKYLGLSFHPELTHIKIFHQILFDPSCKYYYKNFNKNYAA